MSKLLSPFRKIRGLFGKRVSNPPEVHHAKEEDRPSPIQHFPGYQTTEVPHTNQHPTKGVVEISGQASPNYPNNAPPLGFKRQHILRNKAHDVLGVFEEHPNQQASLKLIITRFPTNRAQAYQFCTLLVCKLIEHLHPEKLPSEHNPVIIRGNVPEIIQILHETAGWVLSPTSLSVRATPTHKFFANRYSASDANQPESCRDLIDRYRNKVQPPVLSHEMLRSHRSLSLGPRTQVAGPRPSLP